MIEINQRSVARFERLIKENAEFIKNNDWCKKNFEKIDTDSNLLNSLAVSITILREYYSITPEKAVMYLTEGGRDNKIDLLYFDDSEIYEDNGHNYLDLIVIQSKYKQNSLERDSAFKEDEITICVSNINTILDGIRFEKINKLLESKIEELRKVIKDNDTPSIRCTFYFATNGSVEKKIKEMDILKKEENKKILFKFIDNTNFGNNNAVSLSALLRVISKKSLEEKATGISGFVVKTNLKYLTEFYQNNGKEALLNTNVRYLLPRSSINKKIKLTAKESPELFWFFNNGISIISKEEIKEESTATGVINLHLTSPSIVNGGQTTASISELFYNKLITNDELEKANVLVRIYNTKNDSIVYDIAQATNSQNPIDIVDLKSNDLNQRQVMEFFASKGVALIIKEGQDLTDYKNGSITNESLLQVFAAFYGNEPAKARSSKRSVFTKYFDIAFDSNSINENKQKLFRCYELESFLNDIRNTYDDIVFLDYAWYSIIYCMKLIDELNLKETIVKNRDNWQEIFDQSVIIIKNIVKKRNDELNDKFNINNLFKGSDISSLIELAVDEHNKTIKTEDKTNE